MSSCPPRPIFKATFEDSDFSETVALIVDIFQGCETEKECNEKDWIVLLLYKFLIKEKINKSQMFPSSELWMQSQHGSCKYGQGAPLEAIMNTLSMDVCAAVTSRLGCEIDLMELLLREKDFEMIKDLINSLERWRCWEKSSVFLIKCLEVLLKMLHPFAEEMEQLHIMLLVKFDAILKNLSCKEANMILNDVKTVYLKEICRVLYQLPNADIDAFGVLKSSFEIVKKETDVFLKRHSGSEHAMYLIKELSEKLQNLSLMQMNKKTRILEFVAKEIEENSANVCSSSEKLSVLKAGVLSITVIERELTGKMVEMHGNQAATDTYDLWTQIVGMFESEGVDGISDVGGKLSNMLNTQYIFKYNRFLELMRGWDESDLSIISSYPDVAELYGPILCNVKFLSKLFHELATMRNEADTDVEKQERFNQLLSLVFNVTKNADIQAIEMVFNSSLDIFNHGKLDFFDSKSHKDQIVKELNLVINKLSESNSEPFNNLAQLSIKSPHDALHELVSRGASSAPLSKLVLKFLAQLNSLLLLQREGCQHKEIISIIEENLQQIRKDKYQVMVDFINGLMQIEETSTNIPEAIVSPCEILSHVLLPDLERHSSGHEKSASLQLILPIFQSVLSLIKVDEKVDISTEILDLMKSTFCMVEVLEGFKVKDFALLWKYKNERQLLHVTIQAFFNKMQSFSFDQSIRKTVYDMVVERLPSIAWHLKFYFVNFLQDSCSVAKIPFPVPSQLVKFSTSFGNLHFYGVDVFDSSLDPSVQLWVVVFKICEINQDVAEHFVNSIFQSLSPNILHITTAVSISLVESTFLGWKSVVSLLRAISEICKTLNLFTELDSTVYGFIPENIRCFAWEKSIITHSLLIVGNSFSPTHEQVIMIATQKIESAFIDDVRKLNDKEDLETINCLSILYHFTSLLRKRMPPSCQILDSLILQILETINKKESLKPNETETWNQRLLNFKKYIASRG